VSFEAQSFKVQSFKVGSFEVKSFEVGWFEVQSFEVQSVIHLVLINYGLLLLAVLTHAMNTVHRLYIAHCLCKILFISTI
jgi:hypothetical protein